MGKGKKHGKKKFVPLSRESFDIKGNGNGNSASHPTKKHLRTPNESLETSADTSKNSIITITDESTDSSIKSFRQWNQSASEESHSVKNMSLQDNSICSENDVSRGPENVIESGIENLSMSPQPVASQEDDRWFEKESKNYGKGSTSSSTNTNQRNSEDGFSKYHGSSKKYKETNISDSSAKGRSMRESGNYRSGLSNTNSTQHSFANAVNRDYNERSQKHNAQFENRGGPITREPTNRGHKRNRHQDTHFDHKDVDSYENSTQRVDTSCLEAQADVKTQMPRNETYDNSINVNKERDRVYSAPKNEYADNWDAPRKNEDPDNWEHRDMDTSFNQNWVEPKRTSGRQVRPENTQRDQSSGNWAVDTQGDQSSGNWTVDTQGDQSSGDWPVGAPSTAYDPFTNKFPDKGKPDGNWRSADSRKSYPMSSHHQNTSKRFSEGHFGNNEPNRRSSYMPRNRDSYDNRSDNMDKEYKMFCDEERKNKAVDYVKVEEIQQDLFMMPKEYSLGHCVAEDLRMGSGIAVAFKREFKQVGGLFDQRQKQGGLAVLEDKNGETTRYIYYLITKKESTGKPTYGKFWSSLQKMRDHIRDSEVKKLAIPRLGCGLDRLDWDRVKHMIEFLFRHIDAKITVCNFQQTEESPEKSRNFTCKVVNVQKSIADIEEETTILYLSSEDGHVSSEMERLDKKFPFLNEFKRAKKQLGDVVRYEVKGKYYLLYGCIVRKTNRDRFQFAKFVKCLSLINKNNKKDAYVYVGLQAVKDDGDDDLLMEKIITLLKNYLIKVDVYICWDDQVPTSNLEPQ